MLRITPSVDGEKLVQASQYTVEPGGSESNVAISLSQLGNCCEFVTKLPRNALSDMILRTLHGYSVGTSHIAFGGDRVGTYWTENGQGPRAAEVLYDRTGSSFSEIVSSDIDWKAVFRNASWFHTSGISAAVSENARKQVTSALDAVGPQVNISIDLNYRSKLWGRAGKKKLAVSAIMEHICSKAVLLLGNETDFDDALGITIDNSVTQDYYDAVAVQCFKRFTRLAFLAVSLRESVSASENNWSGMLYVKQKKDFLRYQGPEFRITDIVDRIGTGDSFAAGIIHGLVHHKNDHQRTIDFAVALSALNHTTRGDASQFHITDVEHLLRNRSGRVIR